MKGLSQDMTSFVLTLIIIGIFVVGLVTLVLQYRSYDIAIAVNDADRSVFLFGDYLLSNPCLTYKSGESQLKTIFHEENLDSIVSGSPCINYENYQIIVTILDNAKIWKIGEELEPISSAYFSVGIRMKSGNIKPANMTVIV